MPKKKKSVKKKVVKNMDKMMMENFVSLQKVLLNLSMKLENLTGKISNLLELFEISAKSFAEKEGVDYAKFSGGKELSQKVESLLEQNKTIAKGLAMMYEKQGQQQMPQQFPTSSGLEGYQRSLNQEPENPRFKPKSENA